MANNKKSNGNNTVKSNEAKNNSNNTVKVVTFIDTANDLLASVRTDLRNANKENCSLSRVLKDMQRNCLLDAGYKAVFEKLGITDKIDVPTFKSKLHSSMFGTDKKGNEFIGIWGYSKDSNGKMIPTLRKVTAWSANKIFKAIAQSLAKENK